MREIFIKKNILYILLSVAIILVELAIAFKLPRIPILSAQGQLALESEDSAFAMRRNVFGYDIFVNKKAADVTFRRTHADAIRYIEEKYECEYTDDYETHRQFSVYGWQTNAADVMGKSDVLLNAKLNDITPYETVYMHGMWRYILEYSDIADWLVWIMVICMVILIDILILELLFRFLKM